MTDTAIGFVILGIGLLVVLGIVFAVTSLMVGPRREPAAPPRGVHLPPPSWLPPVSALGMGVLGAGLAFKGDGEVANLWLAIPGLVIVVAGIVAWVRAANREWRSVEHGSHDDGAAH